MLVLIATTDPYGTVASDLHFATEGELVAPPVLDCPDRHCDTCPPRGTAWHSHRITTTAMVVERDGVTEADLRRAIHEWLDHQGAIDLIVQAVEIGDYSVNGVPIDDPVDAVADLVNAHLAEIRDVCEHFEPGTIVSRMGTLVSPRVMRRAA